MGSISAMSSIERVIEKHGEEIKKELAEEVPAGIKDLFGQAELSGEIYSIQVTWRFKDGSTLRGPSLDIDALGDQYPDCEVGY